MITKSPIFQVQITNKKQTNHQSPKILLPSPPIGKDDITRDDMRIVDICEENDVNRDIDGNEAALSKRSRWAEGFYRSRHALWWYDGVGTLVEWKSDLNDPEVMKLSVLGPALSRKEEKDETNVN